MKKKLFVTGVTGFVGGHFEELFKLGMLSDFYLCGTSERCVLGSVEALEDVVKKVDPDFIVHLAGQSFVPRSFECPRETLDVNLMGTLNLLQALKNQNYRGRLLYVSSGDVYGAVAESDLPITELHSVNPRNPYAVSKVSAEHLCRQWSLTEGIDIIIARPFNHVGPRQNDRFVVSAIAKQFALIKLKKTEPILNVGNIKVSRDFLHVKDVIFAYLALLKDGDNGEIYNVCSGQEVVIEEIINKLSSIAGVSFSLSCEETLKRKGDQNRVVGDNSLLVRKTGWQMSMTIDDMLSDIFNYHMEQQR